MNTVIVLVVLAVVGLIAYKLLKTPDQNNDGQVDVKDIVEAAKSVAADAKSGAEKVAKKVRKPKAPK